MRDFYRWELGVFRGKSYLARLFAQPCGKIRFVVAVLSGPALDGASFGSALPCSPAQDAAAPFLCGVMAAALAVETWNRPDYFSPATCALYLVLVQGMRYLWHWSPAGRPLGKDFVRTIPVLACAMILLRLMTAAAHVQIEPAWPRGNLERAKILRQLQHFPGPQLVIVVYGPHHNFFREWVYNNADIDGAKVLWARDMGKYWKSRTVESLQESTGLAIGCGRFATAIGIL